MKGVTKTGFEFEIEDGAMDDYELLEELCSIDKGDVGKIPGALEKVIGTEQKEALKEHVRCENGRVQVSKMVEEFMDIISYGNEGKNS